MAKKLGIDLGSSSLGWFLRDGSSILKNGVVIFNSGMVKDKSGGYTSPTKDRREARSKRRLIQARKYRKWELLRVLIEHNLVPLNNSELDSWSKYQKGKTRKFPESIWFKKWLASDFTYQENGIKYLNPYEIRVKALDYRLDDHELGRALYHLIQRRGYKDIGERDKETTNQIERREDSGFGSAIKNNRTIGEALEKDFLRKGLRARNEYPFRAEYENELIEILKAQGYDTRQDDKKEYTNEFVRNVRKAIIWQRPLRSQKGNIGKCILEPSKPRCPTSHPIFEIFRAFQYINTIKTVEYIDDKYKRIDDIPLDYKNLLFEEVFLQNDKNFKFEKIQKFLDKQYGKKIEYNYLNKSTKKYDSPVSGMPVCKGLISIFGEAVKKEIIQLHNYNIGSKDHNIIHNYSVYDLWHLIFETDNEYLQNFAVKKLGIPNETKKNKKGEEYTENAVVKLKNTFFTGSYSNLSIKAMCKIIPFLRRGYLYDEAVLLAKMPDNIENWESNREYVLKVLKQTKKKYNINKDAVSITNSLIEKYKAHVNDYKLGKSANIFAYNDFEYFLQEDDLQGIVEACEYFYGKYSWEQTDNKEVIIDKVKEKYQQFFFDAKREYRKLLPLKEELKLKLNNEGICLKGDLYHHSDRDNLYPEPIYSKKHNKKILAIPLIDSIKNPMFNKSMSILRRLINELIIQEYVDDDGVIQNYIDENTEIVIEVARELNDNNKRIAIERFQRERRSEREKYHELIVELKGGETKNIEDDIMKLELWAEQLKGIPDDNKKFLIKKQEILAEKDEIKRYELWREQRGQCIYTGKLIGISQLFSSEIEIEHTIPRSLLPDNTMANLTVCFSKYNSDIKNNRLPKECPNYDTEKNLPGIGICSPIDLRIEKWEKLRDHYKELYENNLKAFGNEDENKKNLRIQKKHYYRMHFEYWKDKVNRFTAEEINERWVRRQLVDTQIVSKYALEYLKTYFKKVVVQKGSTTSDFRKIFGVQGYEKKDRGKHTHHSIDAAVLTLISTSSSKRVMMLQQLYREEEKKLKITRKDPDGFHNFNAQSLIDAIEKHTLIVNYEKDKLTDQTYKNVRKRGKFQYIRAKNGERILLKSKGTSIRGKLFQDTFIGKIKNVERNDNGIPIRENGKWKYLKGREEYSFTVRKPIEESKIEDIIDPDIRFLIKEQLKNGISIRDMKDHQGNTIRRVRVKAGSGRKVKERLNYKSKHDYKNAFYAAAGEMPYAIFISRMRDKGVERKLINIPIHEVGKTYKEFHEFTPQLYLNKFHPEITHFDDLKLLKVGQRVFVLNEDADYERRKNPEFQMERMYKITQFSEGNIWLKHHLEARDLNVIKDEVKNIKNEIISLKEKEFGLPQIIEDNSIEDKKKRRKDFEDKKFKFSSLNDYRLKRLIHIIGVDETKRIKENQLDKYKAFSSKIEIDFQAPLLKTSKNNWNFLFESYDFEIDITGEIKWLE